MERFQYSAAKPRLGGQRRLHALKMNQGEGSQDEAGRDRSDGLAGSFLLSVIDDEKRCDGGAAVVLLSRRKMAVFFCFVFFVFLV